MIRRPPRSTLFPTRRSSDLSRDAALFLRQQHAVAVLCGEAVEPLPYGRGVRDTDEGARGLYDSENRRADRGNLSRSEEHTSELQSRLHLVCRLLLEKKNHSD